MITGTGIIGGEVAAGAMIGTKRTGIVEGTKIIVVEAGAAVQVPITTRVEERVAMMMSDLAEVGADQ